MDISSASIIETAYSALQIAQAGIDVTSQNVAGSSVDGYTRRTINTGISVMSPNSTVLENTGFTVESISRITNQLLTQQLFTQKSKSSYTGALVQTTASIDSLMNDPSNSIATAMSAFFNAAGTLSTDAQNITNIQGFAGAATDLASRVNGLASVVSQLDTSTRTTLSSVLSQANSTAQAVAQINLSILSSSSAGNTAPSADILDQRDRLLMQLQDTIGGTSIINPDGTATFQIGGATLVSGEVANQLVNTDVSNSVYGVAIQSGDGTNKTLNYLSSEGGPVSQYNNITGPGTISTATNSNVVTGSGTSFNTQLQAGQTLYDANGHALGIIASIQSATQLTLSSAATLYTSSSAYHYFSQASGSTQTPGKTAFTGGQAGAAFTILTSFIPQIKRQLNAIALTLARDTNGATTSSGGSITPIFGYQSTSGAGGVNTSIATYVSNGSTRSYLTDRWVQDPTTQQYTDVQDSTQGHVLSAAEIMNMADPNSSSYNSTIAGIVNTYDASTFASNISPSAQVTSNLDSTAATTISNLLGTYSTPVTNMTTSIASSIASWKAQDTANTAVQANLTSQQQSVSGVNLDEEAANLVKFQQLYGAASKVIQTANQLFTNLITMLTTA